mmetsp:Transcript_8053/g.19696  ORF Transcript_8053/g.19696 Transcript_8053/m.19696 type:complete len:748 (-) Transcript_8053:146-2389(-)
MGASLDRFGTELSPCSNPRGVRRREEQYAENNDIAAAKAATQSARHFSGRKINSGGGDTRGVLHPRLNPLYTAPSPDQPEYYNDDEDANRTEDVYNYDGTLRKRGIGFRGLDSFQELTNVPETRLLNRSIRSMDSHNKGNQEGYGHAGASYHGLRIAQNKYLRHQILDEKWKSVPWRHTASRWENESETDSREVAKKLLKILWDIRMQNSSHHLETEREGGRSISVQQSTGTAPPSAKVRLQLRSNANAQVQFHVSGRELRIHDNANVVKEGNIKSGTFKFSDSDFELKIILGTPGKGIKLATEIYTSPAVKDSQNPNFAPFSIDLERLDRGVRPIIFQIKRGKYSEDSYVVFPDLTTLLSIKPRSRFNLIDRTKANQVLTGDPTVIRVDSRTFIQKEKKRFLNSRSVINTSKDTIEDATNLGWLLIHSARVDGAELCFKIDDLEIKRLKRLGVQGFSRGREIGYMEYLSTLLDHIRLRDTIFELADALESDEDHRITDAIASCYDCLPEHIVKLVDDVGSSENGKIKEDEGKADQNHMDPAREQGRPSIVSHNARKYSAAQIRKSISEGCQPLGDCLYLRIQLRDHKNGDKQWNSPNTDVMPSAMQLNDCILRVYQTGGDGQSRKLLYEDSQIEDGSEVEWEIFLPLSKLKSELAIMFEIVANASSMNGMFTVGHYEFEDLHWLRRKSSGDAVVLRAEPTGEDEGVAFASDRVAQRLYGHRMRDEVAPYELVFGDIELHSEMKFRN